MKKITCCRKCDKRYPGCHDDCEIFQSEKSMMNREREKIRAERNIGYMNRQCIIDSIKRRKKRRMNNV